MIESFLSRTNCIISGPIIYLRLPVNNSIFDSGVWLDTGIWLDNKYWVD